MPSLLFFLLSVHLLIPRGQTSDLKENENEENWVYSENGSSAFTDSTENESRHYDAVEHDSQIQDESTYWERERNEKYVSSGNEIIEEEKREVDLAKNQMASMTSGEDSENASYDYNGDYGSALPITDKKTSSKCKTKDMEQVLIQDKVIHLIDRLLDGEISEAETHFEARQIISEIVLDGTSLQPQTNEELRLVSDKLRNKTGENSISITDAMLETIRKNVHVIFEETDDDELEKLGNDDRVGVIADILGDEDGFRNKEIAKNKRKSKDMKDTEADKEDEVKRKSGRLAKMVAARRKKFRRKSGGSETDEDEEYSDKKLSVQDRALDLINSLLDGELDGAKRDIDKKRVIAELVLDGTPMWAKTHEEMHIVSDVLRTNSNYNRLGITRAMVETIRDNANSIFDESEEDLKILTVNERCDLIADILKMPPNEIILDLGNIKKKFQKVVNTKTNDSLGGDKKDKENVKVILSALLEGTSIDLDTTAKVTSFANALRLNSLSGAVDISDEEEQTIKSNIIEIFKMDDELDSFSFETKCRICAIQIESGEIPIMDMKKVMSKIVKSIDKKTGGTLKEAPDREYKRKVITSYLLKNSGDEDIGPETIAHLLTNGNVTDIESDVEKKIKENAKNLYEDSEDDILKQIKDNSKLDLVGLMLTDSIDDMYLF